MRTKRIRQVLAAASMLALALATSLAQAADALPVYGMGTVATFWFLGRITVLF